MANYTPLESPTELRTHIQLVVSDWARRITRTLRRTDELKKKTKKIAPTSYDEYVLTADIEFLAKNQKSGEAISIVVPSCAELTLFKTFSRWNPEAVLKARSEEARVAQSKGARVFRKSESERARIGFFMYTEHGFTKTLTIMDDGELRLRSMPTTHQYAS